MKTNVTMKSADRELFGIIIKQQTSNSFVSVTDLQKAYDKARWQYGWHEKNLSMIMQTKDFKERVYHLLNERGLVKLNILSFMEMIEKEGVAKVMKGLGVWKTTGKGANRSVYSDPYIWVLLAMELNPLLYAKVVIWITDTLIFDRIEAGSEYRPMNAAINMVIEKPDYSKFAKEINKSVFGEHKTGIRQLASSAQLKKIADVEKFVKNGIECGMIRNEEQILHVIKKYN